MNERERDRSRERMISSPRVEKIEVLERNTKKIRDDDVEFTNKQSLAPRVEDWMSDDIIGEDTNTPEMPKRSYKDACTEDQTLKDASDEEDDWWKGDGWKSRIEVEMTQKGPNIIVSSEFKKKLARKWSTSLIVRLLGRMVREDQLGRKLQQLWGRRGEVETIEIGSGYFLVRMSNKEDYDFALTGGPWLYMDHYLAVQPWKSEFDPDAGEVAKIAAWVRIPKFPVDFYDKGILYVVGNQIGRVLKVDTNTLQQTKGRFARICVEIDLNAPLLPSLLINGKEKKIVYEGLHLICFSCGRYGHDTEHCPNNQTKSTSKSSCMVNPSVSTDTTPEHIDGMYGEWMVAPRRRRGQWISNAGNNNNGRESRRDLRSQNMGGGSRFEALTAEDMGTNDGGHGDSINQEKIRANSKIGERSRESKVKSGQLSESNKGSKGNNGSDILNVGRNDRISDAVNNVGPLKKLNKPRGIQADKKKGIEEGASQRPYLLNSHLSNQESGPSSSSSGEVGSIIKKNAVQKNSISPTIRIQASNPLDPGAGGRESNETQVNLLGGIDDVMMHGVDSVQEDHMPQ